MFGIQSASTGALFLVLGFIAWYINASGGPDYGYGAKLAIVMAVYGGATAAIVGLLIFIWH